MMEFRDRDAGTALVGASQVRQIVHQDVIPVDTDGLVPSPYQGLVPSTGFSIGTARLGGPAQRLKDVVASDCDGYHREFGGPYSAGLGSSDGRGNGPASSWASCWRVHITA